MIYLKRIWNLIAMFFVGCFFIHFTLTNIEEIQKRRTSLMKKQKVHNALGKLVGILYIDEDEFRIEIVKDGCQTNIIIKDGELVRVETFFLDRR